MQSSNLPFPAKQLTYNNGLKEIKEIINWSKVDKTKKIANMKLSDEDVTPYWCDDYIGVKRVYYKDNKDKDTEVMWVFDYNGDLKTEKSK